MKHEAERMEAIDDLGDERPTLTQGDIESLLEAGSDGGSWMGYYAKGHHDPWLFAHLCNYGYGHDDPEHRRYIRADRHVKHEWWRTVPIADDPGQYRFMAAKPGARGAFKVTVADMDGYAFARKQEERKAWEDQGRRSGITDALRFCAARFGVDFVELVEAWNAARDAEQPRSDAQEG